MTPELEREGEAAIAKLEQVLERARRESQTSALPDVDNLRRSVINARKTWLRLVYCTQHETALQ